MKRLEAFIPKEWKEISGIDIISEESIIIFGSRNLDRLISDIKARLPNAKNKEELIDGLTVLFRASCKAKDLPVFANKRECGSFRNGDRALVLHNGVFCLAIINNAGVNNGDVTINEREGNFSMSERFINITLPKIIKIDDFIILANNPEYIKLWARISGMGKDSADAFTFALEMEKRKNRL